MIAKRKTILTALIFLILFYFWGYFYFNVIDDTLGGELSAILMFPIDFLLGCITAIIVGRILKISEYISYIISFVVFFGIMFGLSMLGFYVADNISRISEIFHLNTIFQLNTIDAFNIREWYRKNIWIYLPQVLDIAMMAFACFVHVAFLGIKYIQNKNRLSLVLQRNHIQLSSYKQLIQNYQDKKLFYHDLKNQYLVLEQYIKNKEYAKAEEYMEKLKKMNVESLYECRTGIQAVDILLDYKIKEATAHHIQVEAIIDTISLPLSEQELISLLGNAIDNAIEACNNMTNGEKWIHITIKKVQEMTIIKIINPYEHQPIQKSGKFISSKSNYQLHGLGIKSMNWIVEKHEGKLKIEYANGEFSLVISFFC